jgi:hypothetical protein
MTPQERLAAGASMSDDLRALVEAGVRARHPEYSAEELRDSIAVIMVGRTAGPGAPRNADRTSRMTAAGVLAAVLDILDQAGVPYMVTGSLASTFHGEPRATRDLDLVIDPDAASLSRLVDELARNDFYVDREAALTALQDRGQFHAITPDAWKVDFIIRRDRPFSVEEFGRRQRADLLGRAGYVATAEDTVIAKLEWAAVTGSERQIRDVAGMLTVRGEELDWAYLRRWIDRLGLQAALRQAQDDAALD